MSIDSAFTAQIKAAFNETLDLIGVPIVFDSVEKQCIASPIKFESELELVGRFTESTIRVTMLAEDFDEFDPVPNVTKCTIDDTLMTITEIERDPADPCVEFRAIGDK